METSAGADTAARAGRREWLGLAVLALPTLLLSLDLSVLYLALPRLTVALQASSVQQLWITDIYGFMIAGFLVTMGTVGDRIGRRRLLLIGGASFGAFSVLAAFSTSPEMLIIARALLGIAGATLMPSTLALISTMFKNPKQLATAMAAWMSCLVGGNALGPVLGGLLLQSFWWGSVFLIGVPVMVLLLVAGPLVLPEFRAPHPGRLDLISVALSMAAILPAVYGLKEIARHGLEPAAVIALVVGLAIGVVFARRQRKLDDPLLDLRMFSNRTFSSGLTIMLGGGVFLGGTTLLVTQYMQVGARLDPLHAGLWLLPAIVAMIIGSMVGGPVLARKFRPAYVVAAGMVIAAIGYLVLALVGFDVVFARGGHDTVLLHGDTLALVVVGWALALGGNGLPAGLLVGMIIGSAPPEKAGSASAIQQTGTELGLALGIALLGSLGTAVYRSGISGNIPADVPPDAAAAASESVNGALVAGERFPQLLAPAHDAYTAGLNVACAVSAVVFLALAVLSARALGRAGAQQADQADQQKGEDSESSDEKSRMAA
ncbi:MFS transporter [Amycolatopsis sp. NPDC051716]|jgi:DHA2 family multidrug resistance protein-like MFS transporter|uniref:MFS transporter n=1 Tax=Amycolatopsis sp. NPDC051716 TaxID=3155804 RepID=UPI00342041DE